MKSFINSTIKGILKEEKMQENEKKTSIWQCFKGENIKKERADKKGKVSGLVKEKHRTCWWSGQGKGLGDHLSPDLPRKGNN